MKKIKILVKDKKKKVNWENQSKPQINHVYVIWKLFKVILIMKKKKNSNKKANQKWKNNKNPTLLNIMNMEETIKTKHRQISKNKKT